MDSRIATSRQFASHRWDDALKVERIDLNALVCEPRGASALRSTRSTLVRSETEHCQAVPGVLWSWPMTIREVETVELPTARGPVRTLIFRPTGEGRHPGIVLHDEHVHVPIITPHLKRS